MIEQHYTDEALLSLLDTRGSDTLLGDPHLAACGTCADALESYRDLAGLLCDKEVWDEEDEVLESAPVPETLSRIRAFADATAREDAEAVDLVNELLDMPAEWWAEEVRHDERYHTAGVVRRLVAVAHEAIDVVPAQAVELTAIATTTLELLDADMYAALLQQLTGQTWRERGFALHFVDRKQEAMAAARRAESAFKHCVNADVDIARNEQLIAMIQWNVEELGAAAESARRATEIFGRYGLTDRKRAARWVETGILYQTGNYQAALERFREIESEIGSSRPSELAGVLNNIANCHRELSQFDQALPQYRFALGIHEELGNRIEVARVRWNIGQTFAAAGRMPDAIEHLRFARTEFKRHDLPGDVALINLNLAEVALAQGDFAVAEIECRSVVAYFEGVSLPYSSKALAALSYLREAVEQRKASAAVAQAVRRYVTRLPQQPNLLFAPLPLP